MELAPFYAKAVERLKRVGIDNPQLDARLLIEHALRIDRAQMLCLSQRMLTETEIASIDALLQRRENGEPVSRIHGCREFWGLCFGLNEATLDPRADSETLIEAVLRETGWNAKTAPAASEKQIRILDLGTGTGCLLLALLHEIPNAVGTGVDINPRAVEQARINAQALGLSNRATFQTGNWLNEITQTFDIIVSNPPYIPSNDIPSLMRDVREHDPLLALDGGTDGLSPYRNLIPKISDHLNGQGLIAFEIGIGQANDVQALLRLAGFTALKTHFDLGRILRCVTARSPA